MYETENSIYLVLELVNGGELIKRISKEKLFKESDLRILLHTMLSAT